MLTGLILGKTLNTKPEEMFKALIEATAFGCLKIINQIEKYKIKINEIIAIGGSNKKLFDNASICRRNWKKNKNIKKQSSMCSGSRNSCKHTNK